MQLPWLKKAPGTAILASEEQKEQWLRSLTPQDIPRELYYLMRDEWYANFDVEALYQEHIDESGFAKFLPYVTPIICLLTLLKVFMIK